MYTRHTELRRLHERDEYNLALKLNERDCWRLMEIIPHHINAQQCSNNGTLNWQQAIGTYGRKYRHEHFELMKNAFRASGGTRLVSQILLDEWKTSGRKEERPTLGVLLQLLVGAECWMAADFLATELLHETKPDRPLDGPAARFHFPISEICADVEDYVNDSKNYPESESLAYSQNGLNSMNNNNRDYRTKFMLDKRIDMETQISCDGTNLAVSANNLNAHYESTAEVLNGLEPTVANEMNNTKTNNTQSSQTSTTTTTNTEKSSETISTRNIPLISTLMTKESSHINVEASSQSSLNITDEISSDNLAAGSDVASHTNEVYTFLSEAPIPNLSILSISPNAYSNPTEQNASHDTNARITQEILPVLSELYINSEKKRDDDNDEAQNSSSSSSMSNDEQASNDGDQLNNASLEKNEVDVDDQSVPNLSIFEQHSSNNDSSLTSVTGTSGENSFELCSAHEEHEATADSNNIPVESSIELETSDSELPSQDNIPCLSALRQ